MKMSIECKVLGSFWIYIALMVFLLPLPWLVALIIASICHELGHIFALRLMHKSVNSVILGPSGALILTEHLTQRQEVCAAFAGPAAGILLALTFFGFPRFAICALIQSLFNLIPVYPLDGGRIVRCLIRNTP